jgi:hypothetical protein
VPDYAGLADTSSRLIAASGRSMSLRRLASSGADPWNPTLAATDTTVTGVVTAFDAREIGDLVQRDDKRILIDSTTEPKAQDRLVDGSIEYQIINVRQIKPGGTAVLYIVQARL